jgi:hypothetical protein
MNQENWKCIACTSSSLLFNVYRGSLPGQKWPVRKVEHSLPSSATPHMLSWRGHGQVYLFASSNVYRLCWLQEFKVKRCEANHCHGYGRMKLYIHCPMCPQLRCFFKHRVFTPSLAPANLWEMRSVIFKAWTQSLQTFLAAAYSIWGRWVPATDTTLIWFPSTIHQGRLGS